MVQICSQCGEETSCPKCNNFKPSIKLIMELSKASKEYGKLSEKYEIAKKFIIKIIHNWGCDPNHADGILNELERMDK